MNGLTGAEATKGFILNEIYNVQKENEKCGCGFGKITREKTDHIDKRQAAHESFMATMAQKMNTMFISTIVLAILTGFDVMGKLVQWLGIIK
jgi:hypothetical protein